MPEQHAAPAPSGTPALARTRPETLPVARLHARDLPYETFLKDHLRPGVPLVIEGGAAAWPAMSRWTPEFFKQRFGSKPVRVSYDKEMPFDDFIDAVLASTEEKPGPYMFRLFLHEHLPELLEDLSPPNPFAFPGRYASPLMLEYWRRPDGYLKLLIGGIGGRFPVMHFDGDNAHAMITEIHGDKEFVLFAPADAANLYPAPERPNHSQVDDPMNQDRGRFPLLARARPFRAVLKPGDSVFVPCGWWHTARALSPSISVCNNMLDGSSWAGFREELSATEKRPLARLRKRGYLLGLGWLLSAAEKLQEISPAAARALRVPAWVAPIDSTVAPDPSKTPLQIRYPSG